MRPTFMGLETAKRGLMVNQKAIDIVGNNITNMQTKGYTRQRLDTVSVQVYGGMGGFQTSSIPLAGPVSYTHLPPSNTTWKRIRPRWS